MRRRLFKKAQGNIFVGIIALMLFCFAFAVIIQFVYPTIDLLHKNINSDPQMPDISKQINNNVFNNYAGLLDGLFLTIFVGLWIICLVLAFYRDTHPLMFPIMLLIFGAFIFISAALANTYFTIHQETGLANSTFPYVHWVLMHFPWMMFAILISILLVSMIAS